MVISYRWRYYVKTERKYCMDSITTLIKNEIKAQYKSLSKFSEASGIPYSTLSNALAKGIGGTSYDTVMKICHLFNREFYDIYSKLTKLDDQGVHTVCAVLNAEYSRCSSDEEEEVVKAFNGIGYASRREDKPFDPERIKDLVKRTKNDG